MQPGKYIQPDLDPSQCQVHLTHEITHMCCARTCLMPLCGKCIKEHLNLHKVRQTYAEIEPLEDLYESCGSKVRSAIVNYTAEHTKLEQLSLNNHTVNDECIHQIRKTKQIVISMIDQFFENLEDRYSKLLNEGIQDQSPKIFELLRSTAKTIQKLDNLYLALDNNSNSIGTVQYLIQQDFEQEFAEYHRDLEKNIGIFMNSGYVVRLDDAVLDSLHRELSKAVTIYHDVHEAKPSQSPRPRGYPSSQSQAINSHKPQPSKKSMFSSPQTINGKPYQTPKSQSRNEIFQSPRMDSLVENFQTPKSQSRMEASHTPQSRTFQRLESQASQLKQSKNYIDQSDYVVTMNDYFDSNVAKKYMHFFQYKSKTLHLLDLDEVAKGKCEFELIELNISFKIPRWHRSIVTPFSEIYLTGGVDVDNAETKLNDAYVYDFNNRTLIAISPMLVGRSGHAMVYLNGYIYVVGGFTGHKDFSDKCERYNIRGNSWEEIGSLNVRSNNPACCTFRNKFIYKFGGRLDDLELSNTIERYDPLNDQWDIIDYELPANFVYNNRVFNILSSLGCVQINHYQVMVFGGTRADFSVKSDECWLLSIEEEDNIQTNRSRELAVAHRIKAIDEANLPFAEGFWNNQAVIDKKVVYCFQNIRNEKDDKAIYLDCRRVLAFDTEYHWTVLN